MRQTFGGNAQSRLEDPAAGQRSQRASAPASPRARFARAVRRLALIVAAGTAAASAQAQDDVAGNLLRSMSTSLRTLDYQGSFVYEHNGEIDALRLFHEGGARERERLVSLSGPRSEVVRDGNLITCVQADRPAVLFPNRIGSRLLPLVPDTGGSGFSKLYAVQFAGEERVAGYRARVVDILPRDGYRYGYRLWLEADSSLPLRSAVIDSSRRMLEQFMFVSLDINAKPKSSDLAPSANVGVGSAPDEVPLSAPPRWRVADAPPGFAYLRGQRPTLAPTQAEHHVYSDGVANVSVYVEPRDPRQPDGPDGVLTRGVLNIYSRIDGDWKITVLGDVPRATVQRIARSVQPAAS
ncbi:MucB/RseB C-terminal domain-containing protein [Dokdonella ginsengisoli]|uniref:MucB/RseB C-terminal domain-containing protein n=1 Tax=Dokdonella ginsengisoli TaxID=363846 RepID=A0ABV9QWT7_9GAMM